MIKPFTTIEEVIFLWPSLEWRHHGAGLLQAYNPADETQRIHIWHPSLLKDGIEESGSKHDHRFELHSQVLTGSLLHTRLYPIPDDEGDHEIWRIEGASDRAKAKMIKIGRVHVEEDSMERMMGGDTYGLCKNMFHWARPDEGICVTAVKMINKSGWASLLAPYNKPPVHAFDDKWSVPEGLKIELIEAALHALKLRG